MELQGVIGFLGFHGDVVGNGAEVTGVGDLHQGLAVAAAEGQGIAADARNDTVGIADHSVLDTCGINGILGAAGIGEGQGAAQDSRAAFNADLGNGRGIACDRVSAGIGVGLFQFHLAGNIEIDIACGVGRSGQAPAVVVSQIIVSIIGPAASSDIKRIVAASPGRRVAFVNNYRCIRSVQARISIIIQFIGVFATDRPQLIGSICQFNVGADLAVSLDRHRGSCHGAIAAVGNGIVAACTVAVDDQVFVTIRNVAGQHIDLLLDGLGNVAVAGLGAGIGNLDLGVGARSQNSHVVGNFLLGIRTVQLGHHLIAAGGELVQSDAALIDGDQGSGAVLVQVTGSGVGIEDGILIAVDGHVIAHVIDQLGSIFRSALAVEEDDIPNHVAVIIGGNIVQSLVPGSSAGVAGVQSLVGNHDDGLGAVSCGSPVLELLSLSLEVHGNAVVLHAIDVETHAFVDFGTAALVGQNNTCIIVDILVIGAGHDTHLGCSHIVSSSGDLCQDGRAVIGSAVLFTGHHAAAQDQIIQLILNCILHGIDQLTDDGGILLAVRSHKQKVYVVICVRSCLGNAADLDQLFLSSLCLCRKCADRQHAYQHQSAQNQRKNSSHFLHKLSSLNRFK